jgi:hypothetical protein
MASIMADESDGTLHFCSLFASFPEKKEQEIER